MSGAEGSDAIPEPPSAETGTHIPSSLVVGASMDAAELLFLGEMASFLAQSDHSFDRQRGQSLRKLLGIHAAIAKAVKP